jgi:hypothetical protein
MDAAQVVAEWVALEADIVRTYSDEKSLDRTAGRLGLGVCQVRNILKKNGVKLPGPNGGQPPRVPLETEAHMAELFAAGWSRYRIARETGWSEGAVLRAVQRRGLVRLREGL